MRKIVHALLMVVPLAACSFGGPLREDAKATDYRLGTLADSRWTQEKDPEAGAIDRSYVRKQGGSVIAVSSVCKRYEEVSLEALRKDLVNPMSDRETVSEERRDLDGREALYSKVRGRLDGVPVESYLVTLRKNDCIFDFTIFSRGTIPEKDEKDFMNFVQGFHYAGGRDTAASKDKP